jgi:HD-GYP domain-containing protein (c-di-GMP phosphodiesterase class II)
MDYVRQSQARLLLGPVLARLRQQCRTDDAASALLLERLAALKALPPQQQRYSGGNLANLLAQLRGELRGSYLSTIAMLVEALEAKDPFLRGHSEEVADYVHAVAERLDLDPAMVVGRMATARLQHDADEADKAGG